MPDTAWDRLTDLVERLAGDASIPLTGDVEDVMTNLVLEAQDVGSIDTELDARASARWIVGLAAAHRAIRSSHRGTPADDDLAQLLVILVRWLHPARPR